MQPAPQKHQPEVVYRRTPEPGTTPADRGRGFAPAIVPLVTGFLLLLVVTLVLGLRSAQQLKDVGFSSQQLNSQYSARLNNLLDLRLKLIALDNEARLRSASESRRELKPPFDFRLGKARDEARDALKNLGPPPSSDEDKTRQRYETTWKNLNDSTESYIEITEDLRRYSLDGFESFKAADTALAQAMAVATDKYQAVDKEMEKVEKGARRSILGWIGIALAVGVLVATGTIWQVQRHFSQMRRSVLETRRERTFATQLLEGMVSAVAAIDEEDRIRSANAAFFSIFPNATIGASVLERLAPDDAMKMLEAVTAIRVTKATYHGRWIARIDSEDKAFDVYSSPLAIDGDRGQIVTLVDATEAAASERTLRRSESLAAVGQATTQVAHEIRNPLGSIRLGVSMLRDSVSDPDALNTIELVERGIKHLNKLVVDVTQFSRQKELERSHVDLHESLERSIDLVSERIREKNTKVETVFNDGDIVGQWDPYQLRQVFVNVIANAVDASQENAAVMISTELLPAEADGNGQPAKNYARITIADQGRGMDQATRDRIFEPFFSTKKRGTGLGLAIVKQIVEQHGGRITVASEPGKGSKFNIDLPV
ncbi:MAG TPA: ATP-binding protein [Pyrinomonadaceae bacterium]|nr:ATP-binding protein [Pyrinomonadaceae bacterium]